MPETAVTIGSFLLFVFIVALYSYQKTKGVSEDGVSGFFLAGRGLSASFIVGSLLLSNLSAEQLVGLNGNAYRFDISGLAWESTAALATIVMALFFLPRYLRRGISTMSEFLEERFDATTRRMVSLMFLVGYTLMVNPSGLYLGAITMDKMFGLHQSLQLSYESSIAILCAVMGTVSGLYAVFGGLKAVAVSDTINGVILLAAALLIPVLGLIALGHGSFLGGVGMLLQQHPQQLNAVGGAQASVPFSTIFTGMLVVNLFYWCTNQMIIQRALGASSLAQGQKGVLLAGCFKLLLPLVLVLPGLIAFNLFGGGLPHPDVAYPTLVQALLPWWLSGLFAAALFGTVVSHFNSIINSGATLFTLDLYQPLSGCRDERKLVWVGKLASLVIAIISIAIAPLLLHASSGIFELMRKATGFYSVPIICIVLMGFLTRHVPALAAKWVLVFHLLAYGSYTFFLKRYFALNFIHVMGLLFVIEVGMMWFFGHYRPQRSYQPRAMRPEIPMRPWRYARLVSTLIVAALVSIYITLSPLGVAKPGPVSWHYPILLLLVWGLAVVAYFLKFNSERTVNTVIIHAKTNQTNCQTG
ncbi:solute:sodium symporter family transporter [Dongshaea marina]|uniref:solute:sodium symporter family transporter n=1 Tax=Dongshaea marina TaxID=2047966 RepID=UPI000D3E5991|nr:solute:sodium symporter family transporter [Dongshaea marina]